MVDFMVFENDDTGITEIFSSRVNFSFFQNSNPRYEEHLDLTEARKAIYYKL